MEAKSGDYSFLERKKKIQDLLEQNGSAKIGELSGVLAVSEITVRRDLDRLEAEGLLVRTHGGALRREPTLFELFDEKRVKEMGPEKRRIGQSAAAMVKRGDAVFLDSGTTTLYIARALKAVPGITIVTNSIYILAELRFAKDLNLILLGGTYRPGDYALSGPITERNLDTFRAKTAFLGADGVTVKNGATTNDIYTAEVTKLMMARAETSVLVADHTKIGQVGSIKYAEVGDFDLLITDKDTGHEDFLALRQAEIEIKEAE